MKTKLKVIFISLILSVFFCISCSNLLESNGSSGSGNGSSKNAGEYNLTGTLSVEGAVPSEIADSLTQDQQYSAAKTAGISVTTDSYDYYVSATSTAGVSKTIKGVIKEASVTFTIGLSNGTWSVYGFAAIEGDLKKTPVFKSDVATVTIDATTTVLSQDFLLKPISEGEGTINLTMTVPSSVTNMTATCISESVSGNWAAYEPVASVSETTATLVSATVDSIQKTKAGSYTVRLDFYDAENNLLYSTTQLINVFSGLETNTWISNGTSSLITTSGNSTVFKLTSDLISGYAMTIFYVDGKSGDDSYSGTWVKPLKTVRTAVNKCTYSTKDYTIYLMSDTNESGNIIIDSRCSKSVTIKSNDASTKRTINRGDITATIIYNEGTLTMENIIIDGNQYDSSTKTWSTGTIDGSGINNIGTLTLTDCIIKNCATKDNGGGIYSSGAVNLYGSTEICNNKANNGGGIYISKEANGDINCVIGKGSSDTVSIHDNAATDSGGAISGMSNGRFTMNSGEIHSNSAANGGAIYLWGGNDYHSEFTLNKGSIYSNTASSNGGAVCIDDGSHESASFTMTGGTVYGNRATNGKAIYNENGGKINLSGNAYINPNNDIYLASGKVVTIAGALSPTDNGTASGTAQTYTATITPKTYSEDTAVLAEASSGLIGNNFKKYTVPNNSSWKINYQGKLSDTPAIIAFSRAPTSGTVSADTKEELVKLAGWTNSGSTLSGVTIILDRDIDLNNEAWTPIGNGISSHKFQGTLNGNGKTVSNMKISTRSSGYDAFIGLLGEGGSVKNLTVSGESTQAGIVGVVVRGGTVENCVNEVTVIQSDDKPQDDIGGVVGQLTNGTVKNCTNNGIISGCGSKSSYVSEPHCGGIVGYVCGDGIVDGCTNTGFVSSTCICAGGIAGKNFGTIRNCINTGNVAADYRAGGIAGQSYTEKGSKKGIYNCYNDGPIYSLNTNETYYAQVGGIVGALAHEHYPNDNDLYVINCVNRGEICVNNGMSKSTGYAVIGVILNTGANTSIANNYYDTLNGATAGIGTAADDENQVKGYTFMNEEYVPNYLNTYTTATLGDLTYATYKQWQYKNAAISFVTE